MRLDVSRVRGHISHNSGRYIEIENNGTDRAVGFTRFIKSECFFFVCFEV